MPKGMPLKVHVFSAARVQVKEESKIGTVPHAKGWLTGQPNLTHNFTPKKLRSLTDEQKTKYIEELKQNKRKTHPTYTGRLNFCSFPNFIIHVHSCSCISLLTFHQFPSKAPIVYIQTCYHFDSFPCRMFIHLGVSKNMGNPPNHQFL